MVHYFGLPNAFLTVGPDETRSILVARMAVHGVENDRHCEGGGFEYFHPNNSDASSNLTEETEKLPDHINEALREADVIWQQKIQAEIRYQ